MAGRLSEKVVIVTGAGGGIGLAYARRLAEEGAAVVLADVADAGDEVRSLLESNSRTQFVKTDVSRPADVEAMVAAAVSAFGRVDVLVNNAALFTGLARKPFVELSVEDWQRVLGVNVIGVFNCTKAVALVMQRQRVGKIINIASNVVHKGLPFLLHYVASKGAVIAMTRALARELGPQGITVNALAPGYVMHERTESTDAGRNDMVMKLRALARTQVPEDLVGTLVFLASADSDFITGQTIVVDGGEVFA